MRTQTETVSPRQGNAARLWSGRTDDGMGCSLCARHITILPHQAHAQVGSQCDVHVSGLERDLRRVDVCVLSTPGAQQVVDARRVWSPFLQSLFLFPFAVLD